MSATRMRTLGLLLLFLAAASGPAAGQATSRRGFEVEADDAGIALDCEYRARTNQLFTDEEQLFIARPPRQNLTISVINGVAPAVTAAGVDNLLAAASRVVQGAQNPPGDTECCAQLRRTGALGNFQIAGVVGGQINNCNQLAAVHAINANIKVVSSLNVCTGCPNPTNFGFNGCRRGNSMIVIAGAPASTWAHELGHRQGLNHTGGCPGFTPGGCGTCPTGVGACTFDNQDVMFCAGCGTNTDVSAIECVSFRNGATP